MICHFLRVFVISYGFDFFGFGITIPITTSETPNTEMHTTAMYFTAYILQLVKFFSKNNIFIFFKYFSFLRADHTSIVQHHNTIWLYQSSVH